MRNVRETVMQKERLYETPVQLDTETRDALNDKLATHVETAGMLCELPNGQASIAILCMFDLRDGTHSEVVLSYEQMTELCEVIIRCIELTPRQEKNE